MMKKYQNRKQCPECLSKKFIVKIQYGYPSTEMIEQNDIETIIFGGCSISNDSPDYYCEKCNNKWRKEDLK